MDPALPFAESELPTYDLFISYRYHPRDARWAGWLQRAVENYRLPRTLRSGVHAAALRLRVFRDKEELPASPEVQAAIETNLRRSRYLVVICSSATPASQWVNFEVEYFLHLGRAARILLLLVEGEPATSFPPALLAPGHLAGQAGRIPLAADVRTASPIWPSAGRRRALLSLLSGLIGIPFGALQQRDLHRQRLRVLAASAAAGVALFIMVLLSWRLYRSNLVAEQRQREKDIVAYHREIPIAAAHIAQERFDLARQILDDTPIAPRNWEWGYLRGLCERDLYSVPDPDDRVPLSTIPEILTVDQNRNWGLWDPQLHRMKRVIGTLNPSADLQAYQARLDGGDYASDTGLEGSLRAQGQADGTVEIWDMRQRRLLRRIRAHREPVAEVRLSTDGKRVVSRCGFRTLPPDRSVPDDLTAKVWDVSTGKLLATFEEGRTMIDSMAFSPDGESVLIVTPDRIARLWDVGTGLIRARLRGHDSRINDAVFGDGGALILTRASESLKVWENRPEQEPEAIAETWPDETAYSINNTSPTYPDPRLRVDVEGHAVRLLDYKKPKPYIVKEFAGHTGDVAHLRFTPDGKSLLTVSWDGTARFWDVGSPKYQVIAVGGEDHAVEKEGHTKEIFSAVLLPENRLLTAAYDGFAKIWDLSNGRCLTTIDWIVGARKTARDKRRLGQADIFRLSRDRRLLAVKYSGDHERVHIWDLATGRHLKDLRAPERLFQSAEFSPDGTRLAVVSDSIPHGYYRSDESWNVLVFSVDRGEVVVALKLDPRLYAACCREGAALGGRKPDPEVAEEIRDAYENGRLDRARFSDDGRDLVGIVDRIDTGVWTWKALPPELWHLERSELESKLNIWKEKRLLAYLN